MNQARKTKKNKEQKDVFGNANRRGCVGLMSMITYRSRNCFEFWQNGASRRRPRDGGETSLFISNKGACLPEKGLTFKKRKVSYVAEHGEVLMGGKRENRDILCFDDDEKATFFMEDGKYTCLKQRLNLINSIAVINKSSPQVAGEEERNHGEAPTVVTGEKPLDDEKMEARCSRVNAKGWQCSNMADSGYSLCRYHLRRPEKLRLKGRNQEEEGSSEDVMERKRWKKRWVCKTRSLNNLLNETTRLV
ncbi:hypothetical protein HPP92_009320 [Vanilla planifolia]|uniref:WRC domain-containing protein n=1 Tax=Vanilla planifolia TaxID=51239 RepID=A0A835R413_VANPL|nr:hypothetical protein HPP92_009320 [Vanilla planifolia]